MSDAVSDYLQGKDAHAAKLLQELRKQALHAGGEVVERTSKSLVGWSAKRSFATAYVKGKYLEVSIDLTRAVEHPRLRACFKTTRKILTHRFTFGPDHALDARIGGWLKEAYDTVGPGGR